LPVVLQNRRCKSTLENTENKDFIALDVSPSILNVDKSKLSPEQNGALESFDKMNVLAFKLNETNKEQFESERESCFDPKR
jgi:Tfp pilus assembly ATPase PilU